MKQLKIKECIVHPEAVTAKLIDGLFITRKFVARMAKEQ